MSGRRADCPLSEWTWRSTSSWVENGRLIVKDQGGGDMSEPDLAKAGEEAARTSDAVANGIALLVICVCAVFFGLDGTRKFMAIVWLWHKVCVDRRP